MLVVEDSAYAGVSRAPGSLRARTTCTRSARSSTLAIVVFLTQGVLAFILRGSAARRSSTAFFLANVVLSPLLFIGTALLYVDQAARVE